MARQIRNDSVSQLMNNLTKFYMSGEHSDITLKTNDGKEYKVHKIILRSQSGFFDRALDSKSGWKEGVKGEMELFNDAPENVRAMVDWMYTFSYQCPPHMTSRQERTIFHVQMYAMGDIYDAPSLKSLAARNFDTDVDHRAELFPETVRAVYATTPPSDRGLRDRVLQVCAANISELLGNSSTISNTSNNANTSASISDTNRRKPFRGRHRLYTPRTQNFKGANEPAAPAAIASKAEFSVMMDDLGVFGRELTTYIAFNNPSAQASSSQGGGGALGGSILVHRYRCGVCTKICGMELPATTGGAADNEELISCMYCQAGFSPNNWRSRRVEGPAGEAPDETLGERLASSSLDDGSAIRAPPLERADAPPSTAGGGGESWW